MSTPPATRRHSSTEQLAELRRLSAQYTAALRELADIRGNGPLQSHAAEFARRDKLSATLARLSTLQQARSRFMDAHDLSTREVAKSLR